MKLAVIIATRNRWEKLRRTLNSIPKVVHGQPIQVIIGADGCIPPPWVTADAQCWVSAFEKHQGATVTRNKLLEQFGDEFDAILYATDDIAFYEGVFPKLIARFEECFPDTDGVLGLKQEQGHHPTGVAIVGNRFLARYPNCHLFCEGYFHFAAQEVKRLAEHVNKFAYTEEVMLTHFHPQNFKEEMDQTHIDARAHKVEDMVLIKERERRGEIWGL